MGNRIKMWRTVAALFCVLSIYRVTAEEQDAKVDASGARQPRLFYVTTQSTTSTVTTASYCWATSAATTGTCKRKRSGNFFPASALSDEAIVPSKSGADGVIAGSRVPESELPEGVREGKFVLYWLTTTSTSTTTAYSTTSTIASLTCTPSGFGLSSCG